MRIFIFLLIFVPAFNCYPGNSIENELAGFVSEIGNFMYSMPSSETGAKVARWKPEDKVNPEELGDTYAEGDILIPPNSNARNGLSAESARWKNGVVPYRVSDDFNYKDYNMIMSAIEEYNKHTCVRWVRWSGEDDYVYFVAGNTGCWSSVGRVGGMQELNLQTPGCLTKKGTVIHEMLHALGFLHEQNRYERDSHVSIMWQNIQRGRENNFQKATADTTDNQGVPYDYRSVMHYSANAFSANGQPTIVPKIKGVELGQREGLSRGDVKKIRKMYKCPAEGAKRNI